MIYVSKSLVWNAVFLQSVIAALSARPAAALAPALTAHLYNNPVNPSGDDTVATYTETAFSGYVAAALTPSGPVRLTLPGEGALATSLFVGAGGPPFVPDNLQGVYYVSGGLLVASERFPQPMPIAQAGDFLDLTTIFPYPFTESTGQ
jgi:hypothetical protein